MHYASIAKENQLSDPTRPREANQRRHRDVEPDAHETGEDSNEAGPAWWIAGWRDTSPGVPKEPETRPVVTVLFDSSKVAQGISLNQESPVTRAQDEAIVRELLEALPETERAAIARYYTGLQSAAEIESSLRWVPGRLAEIRMDLRKRFFARLAVMRPESGSGEGG